MRKRRTYWNWLPLWGAAALIILLTGCGGGVRPTNWTALAVEEDVLYVADLQHVRALDANSGSERWRYPDDPGGPFYTVTVLPGEALFVTSQERVGGGLFAQPQGVLRALSIDGSRVLWEFAEARGEYIAPGSVEDNVLVIGNSDGNVYALNTDDGSLAWPSPFRTEGRVWGTPLILSDTVYVASLDHNLYALDLKTGQEKWRFVAEGAMVGPPLALGDRLYIGSFDGRLYALNRVDGSLLWEASFDSNQQWIWGTPASDGTLVFAADVTGVVYAVHAETGTLRWQASLEEPVRAGLVLSADGARLLAAGNNGTVYALDPATGDVLWSKPGDGQIASMTAEGETLYVSRLYADVHVQALRVEDGRTLWTFTPGESES